MLLALAFVPLGSAEASEVVAQAVVDAAARDAASDDCDDQVSVDMVICGADANGSSELLAANGLDTHLLMPRDTCEELLETLLSGRICDSSNANCERDRFHRGDAAPMRAMARGVVAMQLGQAEFPPLMRQVGRRLSTDEDRMPASWLAGPPHGPPRVA